MSPEKMSGGKVERAAGWGTRPASEAEQSHARGAGLTARRVHTGMAQKMSSGIYPRTPPLPLTLPLRARVSPDFT